MFLMPLIPYTSLKLLPTQRGRLAPTQNPSSSKTEQLAADGSNWIASSICGYSTSPHCVAQRPSLKPTSKITHFPPHQGAGDQLRFHLSGGLQVVADVAFSSWVGWFSAIEKGPREPAQPQKEIGEAQVDKRAHLWKDQSSNHSGDS